MIFGEGLRAAPGSEAAGWLRDSLSLRQWTVGGLMPKRYESYLRLDAAPSQPEGWWDAQAEIASTVAGVLARFTATPETSWFAIWAGHGFESHALVALPRFALPDRTYYLLTGHTLDVSQIRWPTEPRHWFRPDLWWPEDRSWFVGTDVDFWCNYIGGTEAMTSAISARLPALCHPATLDEPLLHED